jgi:hypothetical protein
MSNAKYIGLDVHQATTVAAVLDASGKLVMEAIVETKAATMLDFIEGIRGELNVTLEEGTCATWLHDLLEPHVHVASRWLCQIPCIGPIRTALLIALMQTPHRFRTKRQLWAYSGLAVETRDSGEYRVRDGQLERTRKQDSTATAIPICCTLG